MLSGRYLGGGHCPYSQVTSYIVHQPPLLTHAAHPPPRAVGVLRKSPTQSLATTSTSIHSPTLVASERYPLKFSALQTHIALVSCAKQLASAGFYLASTAGLKVLLSGSTKLTTLP